MSLTPLKKELRRVSTCNGVNRRLYVVTLAPGDVIGFRDVRSRETFWTSLDRCYSLAVHEHVEATRAKRKKVAA